MLPSQALSRSMFAYRPWLLRISFAACALLVMHVLKDVMQKRLKSAAALTEDAPAKKPDTSLKSAFAKRLAELREFHERLGHVDVPLDSATTSAWVPKGLGRWVYAQRRRKIEGWLKAPEEAALEALGFRWELSVEELDWDEMVGRLLAYKAQHGNMLVPKKFEEDPLLGAWVCVCRRKADPLYNGGKSALPEDQRLELDSIGFAWEPERRCGSVFMKGLRAYADAHMAGLRPPDEEWCAAQRNARSQGKLSEQRIGYLNKFGFDWGDEESCASGKS